MLYTLYFVEQQRGEGRRGFMLYNLYFVEQQSREGRRGFMLYTLYVCREAKRRGQERRENKSSCCCVSPSIKYKA